MVEVGGVGEGRGSLAQSRAAAVCLLLLLFFFCEERNISVSACLSKILTDICFYVTDIPHSTCTMMSNNLIKCCQRDHLLEGILNDLIVRAVGLKLFMVSIKDYLVCQLCIGCSLSLSNKGQSCAS